MERKKSDNIEYEKRIRTVQEWILDDYPACDILANIYSKWGVSERQAKYYLAKARTRWVDDDQATIREKRRTKVQSLKKQKRNLKEQYKGTPEGIKALLLIDKEIAKLENLYPVNKPSTVNHKIDVTKPVQVEVDQVATVLILPSNGREVNATQASK